MASLDSPASEGRLEDYGFEGLTYPDPTGFNLQGTIGNTTKCGSDISACYLSDQDIANQAAGWLSDRKPHENPWCLTVGFVNPHDKEFFPAGTESQTFKQLFSSGALNPDKLMQWTDYTNAKAPVGVPWGQDLLKAPPSNGYPPLPPNWESLDHLQANKPGCQTVAHQFMAMVWGGVSDERTEGAFSVVPYPQPPNTWGVGTAPFTYWQRSLDSYTQIQNLLDGRIGEVLAALPPAVAANTVVIFTSDHGEYAGAHGFVSGKTSTAYNEALRVPLIVFDPTGRFTGDIDIVRPQLTSSVDLLPLMVSLGYNGSRDWMQGDLAALYGRRYDMLPILRSASRPGRPYVLFATDETLANEYNFLNAPTHMVGIRTEDAKLAVYVNWAQSSTDIQWQGDVDVEFYDYSTPGGRAEVDNMPDDPRAADLFDLLKDNLVPNELRAALPPPLVPPQEQTQQHLIDYLDFVDEVPHAQWVAGAGVTILGYGLNVP